MSSTGGEDAARPEHPLRDHSRYEIDEAAADVAAIQASAETGLT